MSDSCPLPIDWLDFLEDERSPEMEEHLRGCPSCREVLALVSEQAGTVPSPAWTEGLAGLMGARLTEERVSSPAPAELWFSAGRWTFHDAEYRPPERSLVLVLSEALRETGDYSWYDVAPVRTDVEDALPTDFLVKAEESSFDCSLRVVLSLQCKVERSQLDSKVGSLADVDIVISALGDEASAGRWGNPLEGPEDPRLRWEASFAETIEALRGPWLQHLDDPGWIEAKAAEISGAEVLDFVPEEWVEELERDLVAAASGGRGKKVLWVLKKAGLEMKGSFDFDIEKGLLLFSIHRFTSERPMRIRLVLHLKGVDEPRESEEFEPAVGRRVTWSSTRGPREVKQLRARVVG